MARRRSRSRSLLPRSPRLARWFLGFNLLLATLLGGWYLAQPAARQEEVRRLVGATLARDKNVTLLDVAWDIWQLYYTDPAAGRIAAGDKTHLYGGVPAARGEGSGNLRVLANRGFVIGYDEARGAPAWVAYRVRDLPKIPVPPQRPDKFAVDRRTAARVTPDVYSGSGYDRGHLAPNYAIATRYGVEAQRETFLMSNIAPQKPALNSGLWRELEERIATNYPARYEEVWVLTGPVFGPEPRELPRGGVKIPEAFFLIVIDEHEGRLRTLAFLVPQDAPVSVGPARYLTSIDEIERRTRLDFLAELEDAAEQRIEQHAAKRMW